MNDEAKRTSDVLAMALERSLGDAAKSAMASAVEALQARLSEIEERLVQEIASHSGVQKESAEITLQRVAEITADSNHALVSLTQALSSTNQRLNQVAVAIGERIGAVQERIVEGDKAIDQRVDKATQHLVNATGTLGSVRDAVEQHQAAIESRLETIARTVSGVAARVDALEKIARAISALEPKMNQMMPKIDATPLAMKTLEDRLQGVEASQRNAVVEIRAMRRQDFALIVLVVLIAVALGSGLFFFFFRR